MTRQRPHGRTLGTVLVPGTVATVDWGFKPFQNTKQMLRGTVTADLVRVEFLAPSEETKWRATTGTGKLSRNMGNLELAMAN